MMLYQFNIFLLSDGLDFFFATESGARKLVEFLQSMLPTKTQTAKKLISHDANSNLYNYKYTTAIEVVPVCKDNVICLPKGLAHTLGGIGQICIVHKITSLIHLIDPNTCQSKYTKWLEYYIFLSGHWRGGIYVTCPKKTELDNAVCRLFVNRPFL